jgi:hypothetical protein
MTDKQMMSLLLFGGQCIYNNQYYNVVSHRWRFGEQWKDSFTLQHQNSSAKVDGVFAEQCELP